MRKASLISISMALMVVAGLGSLGSCKHGYTKLVEQELAKNVRYDSLFLGLRLGMNKKEFFNHCWELNKKGIVAEGLSNTSVLYEFERAGKKLEVNFYPNFYKNKIASLPVDYSYAAFAPWNPKFSLDTLFSEIVSLQKEWYGEDFLTLEHSKQGTAFVRVDGNRQIAISKNIDRNNVLVLYKDLTIVSDDEPIDPLGE
ncbi:MAG: hypothetical protein ACR2MT_05905 [Aurantibacter sp.]